jgi:hypothetical protein
MPNELHSIPELIAKSITRKLKEDELLILNKWKESAKENEDFLEKFMDGKQIRKKSQDYRQVDTQDLWNKFRAKAKYETGIDFLQSPGPDPVISKTTRRILVTLLILAILAISALFYMRIVTLKNHTYPDKPIQKFRYRL